MESLRIYLCVDIVDIADIAVMIKVYGYEFCLSTHYKIARTCYIYAIVNEKCVIA